MFTLYPKFDDKLKQLRHNTLVSYNLFQLCLFIVISILTYYGFIAGKIFVITIFTTFVLPISIIILARYKYNLVAGLFVGISYLGITYFLFLLEANSFASIAVTVIIYFTVCVLAVLVVNWQTSIALTSLSILLIMLDYWFEKQGIFNSLPDQPIPILAFIMLIIPFLLGIVVIALSYSVTLNSIFKEYKQELYKRQEYEELLIEKNIAVNEMNSEMEESLAQLEESNDQLEIALQKAEESDKLKTSFLQNISHEVRTPLNAIMGFLNLIKENNTTNDCNQDEFIDLTIKSGRRLLHIISDIVELSQIDAGLSKVNETPTNLEELFEEVYSNYLHKSNNTQIELILKNALKGQAAQVYMDQPKLVQILNNLLSNGLRFTKEGSVVLSCMADKDVLTIQVKDTGIGIEPDKIEYIFERFKQVEMDLSRSYGGLGIGLTIVNGLVKCMSGSIEVRSDFGKGTEFIVKLPYKPVENSEEITSMKTHSENKKMSKVLIAEDDQHNYLYLERILKYKDLEIVHAWNGEEAVDLFKAHADIQMVLMDIKMPVMDGLQAFQRIKEINPEVPVIAITAYALNEEKAKFTSYGFDGYLTKPVSKETVLALFK